ncbi:MAG TPA: restriction endonuclease subunit S [Gammaproteobacteria bacterium]|nr:restriction endonuclease subunit S [Gammaproteobacteria bacterium]
MSNVPELRFSGFSENYINHLFENIFLFSTGKNIKQNEASPEYKTPCVRYGELYHLYDEVITQVVNKTNLNESELTFSEGNEILLPSAGEDPLDIGSASALTLRNIAIGRTINILRPKEENAYSQIYVSYYINQKLRKKISTLARGVSISNVYNSDLKTLMINLPLLPEQQKIATFLSAVDKKLRYLRHKQALLETYKRGAMQKIFLQEFRFKQDNGTDFPDWEERLLGDVSERQIQKNANSLIKRVLTNSATKGILDQQDYFDKDIANLNNLMGYYIVSKGDYVYNPRISVHAPVGPINKNKVGDGVMSPLYSVFRFNNANDLFYEQYFKTTAWHKYMKSIANYGARHDRMNITTVDFMAIPLPCPCEEEQQKITEFLSTLDKKLEAVQSQISQTEKFKKGLLQKMFV